MSVAVGTGMKCDGWLDQDFVHTAPYGTSCDCCAEPTLVDRVPPFSEWGEYTLVDDGTPTLADHDAPTLTGAALHHISVS